MSHNQPDHAAGQAARTDDGSSAALPARVRRLVLFTQAEIFLERCLKASWPALGPIAVLLALSLMDVWRFAPDWVTPPVLIGLMALSLYWLWRDGRSVRWPDHASAVRRLDQGFSKTRKGLSSSGKRPLESYEDELANKAYGNDRADLLTARLWARHKQALEADIAALKLRTPRPQLPRKDPYAFRFAALLLVLLGGLAAGGDAWQRLGDLFGGLGGPAGAPVPLVAWVTPPAYTGVAPIYLTQPSDQGSAYGQTAMEGPIEVPTGSVIFARVETKGRPKAVFQPSHGEGAVEAVKTKSQGEATTAPPDFHKVESGVYEMSAVVTGDVGLSLRAGFRKLAGWQFTVRADDKPAIGFTEDPGATEHQELSIPYVVKDDYPGVTARAVLRRVDAPDGAGVQPLDSGTADTDNSAADTADTDNRLVDEQATELHQWMYAPVVVDLKLSDAKATDFEGTLVEDLTAHPWAGEKVTIELEAVDQAGQIGRSERRTLVLPERPFTNPLARAIIEQRKKLFLKPAKAADVARALEALTQYPDVYEPDPSAYLALKIVEDRLADAESVNQFKDLHGMLWDIALQLEDGGRQQLAERMRDLKQQLDDAIAQGRPKDDIDRIIDALKNMMAEYLSKLMDRSLKALEDGTMPQIDPNGQQLSDNDLQRMLDTIEDMLRTGDAQGALKALNQLMNTLQGLQFALPGGGKSPFEMPGDKALNDRLSDLGEIINRQRNLMDETFRKDQDAEEGQNNGTPSQQDGTAQNGQQKKGASPGDTESQGKALNERQQALRNELGEALDKLQGDGVPTPQELDRADRAMKDSQRSLEEGNYAQSLKDQQEAIDQLREGSQSLAQRQLDRRLGKLGNRSGRDGRNTGDKDPLGRPVGQAGPEFGDSVTVPDELDLRRAREILEELRRRAGERSRPKVEQDYLERLLPRF